MSELSKALDRRSEKSVPENELNPLPVAYFINKTVYSMDSRLSAISQAEVTTRGSGSYIPVEVLQKEVAGVITTFKVTSRLSIDKKVGVGKPNYTEAEIRIQVESALAGTELL